MDYYCIHLYLYSVMEVGIYVLQNISLGTSAEVLVVIYSTSQLIF